MSHDSKSKEVLKYSLKCFNEVTKKLQRSGKKVQKSAKTGKNAKTTKKC